MADSATQAVDDIDAICDELLGEDSGPPGPAEGLLAICMAAQEDREFGATAVRQILAGLGLEAFWEEARVFLKEGGAEDEEEPVDATPDDPEPDGEAETESEPEN